MNVSATAGTLARRRPCPTPGTGGRPGPIPAATPPRGANVIVGVRGRTTVAGRVMVARVSCRTIR
ncbi:MAG: hypothetical protein N2508_13385, partial [Anaerolineae bacterium]|nr:hypothetical protein [Anaerolineae bacterium]